MRLQTTQRGKNRVIVNDQNSIPIGTLSDILKYVARHFELSLQELLDILDL